MSKLQVISETKINFKRNIMHISTNTINFLLFCRWIIRYRKRTRSSGKP
jgi:hypothetical protein